jgi:hypothetical protein
MNTRSRRLLCLVVFVIASVVSGCGERTLPKNKVYQVRGVILLNGEPARYVMVRFHPVEPGPEAVGKTDEEGRFELRTYSNEGNDGAVAGQHNVTIEEWNPVTSGGLPKDAKPTVVPNGSVTTSDPVTVEDNDNNDLTVELP